jgi:trimethylamine--corrinoid protein Co-methyltransferase
MNGFHKIALECVNENVLKKIHDASIRILENRGIVVHHSDLREIAKKKGAKVENEIVFFSKSLIEKAIETAPTHFDFHSRNKNKTLLLLTRMGDVPGRFKIISISLSLPTNWIA